MIVTPVRPMGRKWRNLSFSSTLYLAPVLDLLVSEAPLLWQPELRLGLQEALVNAVKHGNSLDPCKQINVSFTKLHQDSTQIYWWIIQDQGSDRQDDSREHRKNGDPTPCHDLECGRGFYILRKIFEQVTWDYERHQLTLCKRIDPKAKPLID